MFSRAVRVAFVCGVVAVVVLACGNSTDSGTGSGGTGGSTAGVGGVSSVGRAGAGGGGDAGVVPGPVSCGASTCTPVAIPIQSFTIPACCADEATGKCGLDSTFLSAFGPSFADPCQPLAQPGTVDANCPDSPKTPVQGTAFTINFPGCCRSSHVCGYQLDKLGGIYQIGLGCVDSSPFLEGGTPASCADTGGAGDGGGSAGTVPSDAGATGVPAAGAPGG